MIVPVQVHDTWVGVPVNDQKLRLRSKKNKKLRSTSTDGVNVKFNWPFFFQETLLNKANDYIILAWNVNYYNKVCHTKGLIYSDSQS